MRADGDGDLLARPHDVDRRRRCGDDVRAAPLRRGDRKLQAGVQLDERLREPYIGRSFPAMLARGNDGALQEAFFDFVFQSIRSDLGSVEGIVVVAYEVTELAQARGGGGYSRNG